MARLPTKLGMTRYSTSGQSARNVARAVTTGVNFL